MSIAASAPVMQRADGAARLVFTRRADGRSALADLYQRTPCRVLFPGGETVPEAVLVTTSGGLTGGDRLALEVALLPGAQAVVTSQAAEKHYRALSAVPTRQTQHLSVAEGAQLEFLPQEAILFNRARLHRATDVFLSSGSRFLAVDCLFFGRTAHAERFDTGELRDRWQIFLDGRLLWADGLRLVEDCAGLLAARHGFDGATALGSLMLYGLPSEDSRDALRAVLALCLRDSPTVRAGVTMLGPLVLARLLGPDAAAVRSVLMALAAAARGLLGQPARLPRVWAT
jgi:urease accessory protein